MATIDKYFKISSADNGQWLGNGEITFISDESGVDQIWKTKIGDEPVQLTFLKERIWKHMVAPNGKDIFFTMDSGGNEQEQIYMLKHGETEAINLTNNDKARYSFGGVKPDGKTIVYASTERNPANYDICQMDITTGKREIIIENNDNYNIPAELSPDGRYLLYNKLKGYSNNYLWMVNTETKEAEKIDLSGEFAQYTNPRWTSDSKGFYLITDVNAEFKYVAYYDIVLKELRKVYEENWDVEDIALSYNDKYLAMEINRDGYSVIEILNINTLRLENIPKPPRGVISYYGLNWSKTDNRLLFSLSSGNRPMDIWMLDMDNDKIERITSREMEGICPNDLIEPTLHRYISFDGLEVPFWYYKTNKGDGKTPVIIDIHGGPEGQERPTFNPLTQYLISQGFSIIGPNVRGSSGYGKRYTHLDDIEKRLDSVKDIESLVNHLIGKGLAQRDKIAVMGASYGGYMTLSSLTEYPDLWAAGVDTVGMSNLETFLENTAEYRRVHRESEYGSLEHHRDILREVSPMHKVHRITAPLMVIHGANDPRVPVSEAEQIVSSLKNRNVPVEYLRYDNEGHGLAKRENQLDCYPKVVKFLKKHLGVKDN